MKFFSTSCLGAAIALAAQSFSTAGAAEPESSRVRIDSGALIGEINHDARVFRGIPYVAPPVGPLRWAPPQPVAAWSLERDATKFGAMCPQPGAQPRMVSGPGYDLFFDAPNNPASNEDCLTLNVWTPVAAKDAPVMLWIHGGIGSGAWPMFDGNAFARDGVVLVTINYRLLTLGHFAHPAITKASKPNEPLGRYSMMDQIAALQWVKRNISAFGGDPNNVTIAGQSAGGAGIFYLLAAPSTRGLFHKAIVQSGGGWDSPFSLEEHEKLGALLATKLGLPGAQATVEQLRALPVGSLPGFGAHTIDGRLMRESFTNAIAADRFADVPLMIGWTDFDGSSLRRPPAEIVAATSPAVAAAYKTENKAGDDLGYAMYTDMHVAAPARWVAKHAADGAPSYLYQFSYVQSQRQGKVRGVAHGGELQFVFDSWSKGVSLSDSDRSVTNTVHCYWVGFVKTGTPQCTGSPAWPRYAPDSDQLMNFGAAAEVLQHHRSQQLDAQESAMSAVLSEQAAGIQQLLRSDVFAPLQSAPKQ